MDERILADAATTMKQAVAANQQDRRILLWRRIMRTKTAKLTTAAAVLVAVFAITFWDRGAAWSVEQTIKAMNQLKTLHIKGLTYYGADLVNFECWVKGPDEKSDVLKMRYVSPKKTVVVQGDLVYEYWPYENKLVKVKDGSQYPDLQYWYEGAKLSPWLVGKALETLGRLVADLRQTVQTDPATGREQVIVTCSYRPSNTSFLLVVDNESKLIQKAKLWNNLHRDGKPDTYAQTFVFNEDLPDEFFGFEIPADATVVNEKDIVEAEAVFDRAEHLFHNEKKYAEAMEIYQQVHDKFPEFNGLSSTSLMMVGLCHHRLGQPDKEIEAYQKSINEYPNLRGWVESTYYYLGRAYLDQRQKEKALEAFEKCLKAGQGVRKPDAFPLKDAREYIDKIKGQ
jgi:tetratricopeptide (TPR) repeat protein